MVGAAAGGVHWAGCVCPRYAQVRRLTTEPDPTAVTPGSLPVCSALYFNCSSVVVPDLHVAAHSLWVRVF
jgi:hypothetical protein